MVALVAYSDPIKLHVDYKPVSQGTLTTVTAVGSPSIIALEVWMRIPAGEDYVEGSAKKLFTGGMSRAYYNPRQNVATCAYSTLDNPPVPMKLDQNGNIPLFTFICTGTEKSVPCYSYVTYSDYSLAQPFVVVEGELPPSDLLPGNPTGSGTVNINDILLVRDFIFGTESPTPQQQKAADLNEDGKIDIKDILLIRDIIFGLE